MTSRDRFEDRSYATVTRVEDSLAEIHRTRIRMIRAGTWPHWCDQEWHDRADRARRSGDVSGPAVRAIETSRALREAEARLQGSAA